MSLLRWLALLALAFWIGGLVALGAIAAPTLFTVLQAHDPAGGRELAGATFGAIFQRFQYFSWVAAVALLVSIGFRAALGPRPRRFGIRMLVATAMLAASLATVFLITPHVNAIAASAGGAISALADDDVRKIAFGRWHGLSSALMLGIVLAGIGMLWAETRDD